ncbi:hypothetical protein A2U01_0082403, partial [Trifolium medium]|nr:hypothetical protein [Trifolium medium]
MVTSPLRLNNFIPDSFRISRNDHPVLPPKCSPIKNFSLNPSLVRRPLVPTQSCMGDYVL